MPDWTPAAILPNLCADRAVGSEFISLAPRRDPRVRAFCADHSKFQELISRFTNEFHVPLDPVVLIVRNDVVAKLAIESLASFRDLVALSVIPYARSLGLVYGNSRRIPYSNSFWIYPWMLSKDNEHLIGSTPAIESVHAVERFHGQSSPELSIMKLKDVDEPLLDALLLRWQRHYLGKRPLWQDRALFRSLNMAAQAAQLPAGVDTTLYDLGRIIALWVSAFEILAHPRIGKSTTSAVYTLLEKVSHRSREVARRTYKAHLSGTIKPRRALPCWLYGKLYQARNDFLHGNSIGKRLLNPGGSEVGLFWVAPCLYRLALTGFLGLSTLEDTAAPAIGTMRFDSQGSIEYALLRAGPG